MVVSSVPSLSFTYVFAKETHRFILNNIFSGNMFAAFFNLLSVFLIVGFTLQNISEHPRAYSKNLNGRKRPIIKTHLKINLKHKGTLLLWHKRQKKPTTLPLQTADCLLSNYIHRARSLRNKCFLRHNRFPPHYVLLEYSSLCSQDPHPIPVIYGPCLKTRN